MAFSFDNFSDRIQTDGTPSYGFYVLGTVYSNSTTVGTKLTAKNGGTISFYGNNNCMTIYDGVIAGLDSQGYYRTFSLTPSNGTVATSQQNGVTIIGGLINTLGTQLAANTGGSNANDTATKDWSVTVTPNTATSEFVVTVKGGSASNPVKWGGFIRTIYIN